MVAGTVCEAVPSCCREVHLNLTCALLQHRCNHDSTPQHPLAGHKPAGQTGCQTCGRSSSRRHPLSTTATCGAQSSGRTSTASAEQHLAGGHLPRHAPVSSDRHPAKTRGMRAGAPGHIVCRELEEHWARDSATLCVGLHTGKANTGAQHQPQRESSKPLTKSRHGASGSRQAVTQNKHNRRCCPAKAARGGTHKRLSSPGRSRCRGTAAACTAATGRCGQPPPQQASGTTPVARRPVCCGSW